MNLIETLEQEEIARLGKTIPHFSPGDTVIVNVNVVEGERKRVQAFEGIVIAKRNRGLNSGFIVRKMCLERRRVFSQLIDEEIKGDLGWLLPIEQDDQIEQWQCQVYPDFARALEKLMDEGAFGLIVGLKRSRLSAIVQLMSFGEDFT